MTTERFRYIKINNKPLGVLYTLETSHPQYPTGHYLHVGVSFCNKNDPFKKELGRKIALGRAKEESQKVPFEDSYSIVRGTISKEDLISLIKNLKNAKRLRETKSFISHALKHSFEEEE